MYAELVGWEGGGGLSTDETLAAAGIEVEWQLKQAVWKTAGEGFHRYLRRRNRSRLENPGRILPDFIIAAHALTQTDGLLTFDRRLGSAFPELTILS